MQQALDHGVLPLTCARLLALAADELPDELVAALRVHLREHRARTGLLVDALADVLAGLTSRGIRAIAFKGPTLSQRAFGDATVRVFSDLDILIDDADVERAVHCLHEQGYRHQAHLSSRQLAIVRGYGGQYFMSDPDTGVAVEPHWSFVPTTLAIDVDYRELRRRAGVTQLPGGPVPTLAPEHEALMLCIHGAKEHWGSLKPVVDLAAFLHRHPGLDWSLLLATARRSGCLRMVLLGVRLCERLLGWPVPPGCAAVAARDTTAATLARAAAQHIRAGRPPPVDPYRIDVFRLRVRERWSDRTRFVGRTLLTPRAPHYDLVALPRGLRWLYVPLKVAWDYVVLPVRRVTKRGSSPTA